MSLPVCSGVLIAAGNYALSMHSVGLGLAGGSLYPFFLAWAHRRTLRDVINNPSTPEELQELRNYVANNALSGSTKDRLKMEADPNYGHRLILWCLAIGIVALVTGITMVTIAALR